MSKNLISKVYLYPAIACASIILGICVFCLFAPASTHDNTTYLYIDNDDDIDSISTKLDTIAHQYSTMTLRTLARQTSYTQHIRPGRYAVEPGMMTITLFRNLRNGHQEPVKLTVPSVRTKERLAKELAERLMLNADSLLFSLNDTNVCAKYGYKPETIICMFVPNTYEVYWNISIEKLLDRMNTESKTFWNDTRTGKANALGLSAIDVITLASIVEEETANNGEKPMIAGMYYNRLQMNMPLQADPTIKFALQQFELKRIYRNLLDTNSPYNTYRNTGLPPGPIRIPTITGIDAVLNLVKHDYIYMCAKEDFSGTHNFAKTYAEHLANARKYSQALDERGIK